MERDGRIPIADPARRALLGDQLRRQAARIGDAEAIVETDGDVRRTLTYAELDARSDALARTLAGAGIGRGDVVALLGRISAELLIGCWGALKAGAAATGVNQTFTAGELHHQLAHSGARAVVLGAGQAARLDELAPLPQLTLRLAADALPAEGAAPAVDGAHEDDPALIPYTSGTTALPKAVMLSHRTYLTATIPSFAAGLGFHEGDRFYYVMPLHTMAGIGSQISLLALGATVVLPTELSPARALRILERERITAIGQTPTFYLQLTRSDGFAAADLSSLQRCITYGGTVAEAMLAGFARAAPGLEWITMWSQSELGQVPCVGRFRSLDEVPGRDAAWIGRPTAQLEIRIVDADGNDAREGELLCRSPGVMLGYRGDPERTAAALAGGWLHTGDLVRRDDGGELFFVDRRHDVIKSGGMNVSSVEVERVLYAHEQVLECAVVGLRDDYWGQVVTAFVVAREGTGAESIRAFARERLAAFKVPKTVRFVDALPKDAQGKILKRRIRAEAENRVA